ncbi:MAG: hypothetical protein A3G59_02025 [Candidatus Taylorbacteria bacterium RIFCSPLOWO2_12_FULL_47_20]|uniref:PDZ domain-containing protein n=2 Tax=Candidatus Tayloriibacteriota TaxID=1817919 RepID=A0A1G2P715_9BACT|nr:MAG: hypothetical protein A3H68_02595 [Candidatus Taylorbacteria bacterium RIFCSPLOWO2_02_FULL_46_40]OHA44118.1 MAG: hypothetical protein A3G59_02025 [Candidatus Taylorbacteria bacterium RIFCSPLOWO2_12_FULL_47_20]
MNIFRSGEPKTKIIAEAIILLAIFIGGYQVGAYNTEQSAKRLNAAVITNPDEGRPEAVDFSPFWKTWEIVNDKFVGSEDAVSEQDRVWGAISGMVASLGDPYTVFLPPEEKKTFEEDISGNFDGIGVEVDIVDGILTVITPLRDNPAMKAGVKAGDKIIKIDETSTKDLRIEEAVKLIRGKKGTAVKLTVYREGTPAPIEISVTRDTITVPTVDTTLRDDGVFVLELHSFNAVSTDLFKQGLREFIASDSNKLVLDLRGNPGGYLDAAVDMASWFLPVGKIVVKEDEGDKGTGRIYRSRGYDIFSDDLNMVVLIDGGSASASEILAGALREHSIAKLVGETTFGKGSVQELVGVTPETSVKITIARWLTPDGVSISKEGIKPDVEVKLNESDIKARKDPQLDKAIEIVNSM